MRLHGMLPLSFLALAVASVAVAAAEGAETDGEQSMKLICERYVRLHTAANVPADDPGLARYCTRLDKQVAELLHDQILDRASESYGSFGIVNGEKRGEKAGLRFDHPWDKRMGVLHTDICGGGAFYRKILSIAEAYRLKASIHYRAPRALAAVSAAFAFGEKFLTPGREHPGNWWAWDIGIPMYVTRTLLLVGDDIDADMKRMLIRDLYDMGANYVIMGYSKERLGDGQNAIWVAQNAFRLGLLADDGDLVAYGAREMAKPSVIQTTYGRQGIQTDGSYHYHGAGVNMAYGSSQLYDVSEYIYLTRGTAYAIPADNLAAHVRFLRDFAAWNVYRAQPLLNSIGRSVSRDAARTSSETAFSPYAERSVNAALLLLASGIEEVRDEALALLADAGRREVASANPVTLSLQAEVADVLRGESRPLAGVRYWPRSEYLIARDEDFCIAVRMASKRCSGWFTIAGEHLKGWYTGEGAVEIQTDGREARGELMPTWPWTSLTGVTRVSGFVPRRDRDDTVRKKGWGGGCSSDGQGDFASGVWLPGRLAEGSGITSERGIGCCGISYLLEDGPTRLSARKAYFVFGNVLILAGNGIVARGSGEPCVTTLLTLPEQSDADTYTFGETTVRTADITCDLKPGTLFYYRNVGFAPLGEGSLTLEVETRRGAYRDISKGARDNATYENRYFTIVARHGVQPVDGSYEAAIVPGVSEDIFRELTGHLPVACADAGAGVIAYRTQSGDAAQAVFFSPGRTEIGAMDTPGALAWRKDAGRVEVAACTYEPGEVTVELPFELDELHMEQGTAATDWRPTGRITFTGDGDTVYTWSGRIK